MDVIFILGSFQSFFLSFLVFRKMRKSTGDFVLGTWLSILGLHLLYYYLFSTGFLFNHPHLLGTGGGLYLLDGPLAFVYVLVMISKDGKFRAVYLLHGIPFLFITIYLSIDLYHLSGPDKLAYYELLYTNPPRQFLIITLPTIFVGPAYVVWSLIKLRKHSNNISDNFSFTEQINLKWLKIVLISLGFVWVTGILSNVLVRFPFFSVANHEDLNYFAYVVAIFFIGYYGIKQKNIYSDENTADLKPGITGTSTTKKNYEGRYLHSGLKTDEAELYLKSLISYFEEQKPYLDGKLSIKDVAGQLNISINHLSQVINEQVGKNFFDFVNGFRVAEVKERLANNKHSNFTLLAIALDSGFNSKSSFNNIFKKATGFTPSQYLKDNQV